MSTEAIINSNDDNTMISTFVTTKKSKHHYEDDINMDDEIDILARTVKEKSSYRFLQTSLNQIKLIMQTIKHTNALYICHEEQWKQKIKMYMEQNHTFQWVGSTIGCRTSNDPIRQTLIATSNQVVKTLHTLFAKKAITNQQYETMMFYNQTIIQNVNRLYFIPELHHNKISIQPIVTNCDEEPICAIVIFVNNLLQPLIKRIVHSNFTFFEGHHVIRAVEKYVQQGLLRSTTLFVKIIMDNLSTTLSHHLLIEALAKFLRLYVESKEIEHTSITTIIKLVELILQNQFCVYKNQLYRQTTGGSNCSSFINGLVDIYVYNLTHSLYSKLLDKNEIFGRNFNQIFFTWNESKDALFTLLNQLNLSRSEYIPTPSMTILIDDTIEFLGAEICHYEGQLQTRVYHDYFLEPYTLPYLLETRKTSKENSDTQTVLYNALVRGLCNCSNVDEFENEILFIELSCIINDMAMDFIEKTIDNFLFDFQLLSAKDACIDQYTYRNCRQHIQGTNLLTNRIIIAKQEREVDRRQYQYDFLRTQQQAPW